MIVRFLKDYKHTIKTFHKDAVVRLMPDFAEKLIKKKVAEKFEGDFQEDRIVKKIMEESDGN